MNLLLRLIKILLAARFRSPLSLFGVSRVRFRVWPNDLDLNRHMNNGRFLTVMDLGRIDLMARMGVLGIFKKRKWMPVVAAETISFKRPLDPFERYELTSRILCWDERFLYLEQVFVKKNGKVAARALVKAAIRAHARAVKTQEILEALQVPKRKSPPIPPGIKAWALAAEWMEEGGEPANDPGNPAKPDTPATVKARDRAEERAKKEAARKHKA
ncbi:MAG: thioesterase family protein [Limibacillus sp.]|jgi:acyl-CoA thioesterase FadM